MGGDIGVGGGVAKGLIVATDDGVGEIDTSTGGGIVGEVQAVRQPNSKRVVMIRICPDYISGKIKNPPPIGGKYQNHSIGGL